MTNYIPLTKRLTAHGNALLTMLVLLLSVVLTGTMEDY